MQSILANADADLVIMGRALLADPYRPLAAKTLKPVIWIGLCNTSAAIYFDDDLAENLTNNRVWRHTIMGIGKHLEFAPLDMDEGWEEPPGYPLGMQQKVLTSDLDEENKTGSRSRFLRLLPGVYSMHRSSMTTGKRFIWWRVTSSSAMTSMGMEEKSSTRRHMRVARRAFTTAPSNDGGCVMFEPHYYYTPESDENKRELIPRFPLHLIGLHLVDGLPAVGDGPVMLA